MSDPKPTVKCLVWDLDNTLWDGTLSEDEEVHIAPEILEVIRTLDSRGILQSIASKNDFAPAWQRLEELGVAEYFVLPHINWGVKSDSVREIGRRLNFAETTLAFIDDQPAERAEVSHHLPKVRCYPAEEALRLTQREEFSPATVTVDSRRRREMYQAGFQRDQEKADFNGPDEEFLRSLDLVLRIDRADDEQLSRVEELTLRTSQMNATGIHYPDQVLRAYLDDRQHEVLTATMSDRFGPHGAIGVLLLQLHPHTWHLKLLATSCRVVSFGAGAALLNWLSDQAARAAVHLVADFRRTDRNRMMEIAYRFAGYDSTACACLDTLDKPGQEDIQRLHLTPARHTPPTTIDLAGPDLAKEHTALFTPTPTKPAD
ncbi:MULTISPECIES: HAD-IIIC family phosphatase [Streptomyces]|uniref:HAD-IIIC family phosphatase n=1 Tax=Streptomyces fimbriatus TaxID=68197 RepID=A0ABW0DKS3_STRFI